MALFGTEGLGVDLGSIQTSIYTESMSEVALRESTSVLVSARDTQDVLCVGREARQALGRTGSDTILISPVQQGAIADVEMAALLIVALCEQVTGRKRPMEKATLVCPLMGGATKVEREALFQTMAATGAKKTAAVYGPVAAALGADMDISRPRGRMIVSLGGGVTEIAVLTMNGIAALRSLRYGGEDLDEAIVNGLRREKGIIIGMRTAEQLKRELGTVYATDAAEDDEPVLLRGKDARTGAPASMQITALDIKKALDGPVERLIDAVRSALQNVPPELGADVRESGIQLTGGGALLEGLDRRLAEETGLVVRMSEHPQDDTVIGLGAVATNDKLLSALAKTGAAETHGE